MISSRSVSAVLLGLMLAVTACGKSPRSALIMLGDTPEEREMLACLYDYAERNYGEERAVAMAEGLVAADKRSAEGEMSLRDLSAVAGNLDIFLGALTYCE